MPNTGNGGVLLPKIELAGVGQEDFLRAAVGVGRIAAQFSMIICNSPRFDFQT